MSAYVIVYVRSIVDAAELAEYRRIGLPTLAEAGVNVLVRNGRFEVLEGDPIHGVVMLEFPSMDEARAWYDSPGYQEALKHRVAGADCQAVLVEGA